MQGSDVLLHRNSTNLTIKYNKSFLYTVYLLSVVFIAGLVAMLPLWLASSVPVVVVGTNNKTGITQMDVPQ